MQGPLFIFLRVVSVHQNKDKIKSTQQTRLYTSVNMNVKIRVPFLPTEQRISCGQDRGSGIDLADYASFGYRDCLLLHRLVN